MSCTTRAAIAVAILLVIGGPCCLTLLADNERNVEPAGKPPQPNVLNQLNAARWRMAPARRVLPPVQLAHKEISESGHFMEYAFEGGALRLYVSLAASDDIFAVLVDTRLPRYAKFAQLASSE